MKEKATYRRFDLLAFLAILGCMGMLLFECFFIFELYDRAPAQVADILQAVTIPPQSAVEVPVELVPAATNPVVNPAKVSPAEIEKVRPVAVPVG